MKFFRAAAVLAALLLAAAPGCGTKSHAPRHGAENAPPAPAPPTPDTTPIEALRTPAGLVLKIEAQSQTLSAPLRGATDERGDITPVPSPSK